MPVFPFTPSQLPQHYQEDQNGSNYPMYEYSGALFLFMSDGVGFGTFGGGTSNLFIYKSLDQGNTWSDVTPVAPVKTEGQQGLIFIRSGNVVYAPISSVGQFWKMVGYDMSSESWIADGPLTVPAIADGVSPSQAITRANGDIVNLFGSGNHPYVGVYSPGSATWTQQPTVIAGISHAEVLGGFLDSVGHIHFFISTWSGVSIGSGTATLQHLVIFSDNSVSVPTNVYTFVNRPDLGGTGDQVSLPAFYRDVGAGQNMMGVLVAVPNASFVNTALLLFTAPESDTPVWTQTPVPTGEDFTQITLANTGVCGNSPVATLLPIQFSTQTQLHIFWTSNGFFFAPGMDPWNNYFRLIVYTNGVFSAVDTLYQSLNTKISPGPIYPFIVSNNGTSALIGGMFPTIDQALFFSLITKYSALENWSMSIAASAPPSSTPAFVPNPQGGGGAGAACREFVCQSPTWGPLQVMRNTDGSWGAIYCNHKGAVYSWPINPDYDVISQVWRNIIGCEGVDLSLCNPGGIRFNNQLLKFSSMTEGAQSLLAMIGASIKPKVVL